ncbi:pyridoxal phosphate-dependent aminotransferase [Saccharothrix syringae]|uniref:Aminotransferase n=1 Tax=Saccharothrix syringae TaxID=103733 RepID=A0A5Q0H381_SACSY|nr:aminotransferase class I/II-fold pyridoxal phosphate-dependent enzyme [Saccharothrix syringae]QFZ20172.1 aminotransferase class I/II-fold pyridoxal phosphate-dependent enzyme [Saccharothrix syringae]
MSCTPPAGSGRTCMGIVDEAGRLDRAGHPVIHLEKGELDLDTPVAVKQAAVDALAADLTRYSHSSGLPELRSAIAEHYARRYGVQVTPDRVVVNAGSSAALLELFLALLDPGDEVVLPDPGYPAYPAFVTAARGVPVRAGSARNGFRHTAELVRPHLTARTRAVLVNFPSNPLGALADRAELRAFAELGPLVVADEVYHGLETGGVHSPSVLEVTDDAIAVGSFSKSYAMTGWRLGWLVLPPRLAAAVTRLHSDLFVGTNTFTQWAAITALTGADDIQRRLRAELDHRREVLLRHLPRLGLVPAHPPDGGFYVFTRQPEGTGTSAAFAAELLDRTHVALTPGSVFGPSGEGNIRFSLSAPAERIAEAVDRIGNFLADRGVLAPAAG